MQRPSQSLLCDDCVWLSESVFVCLSVTGVSASDCGLNSWASRRRKPPGALEREMESGPLPMMAEKHLTFDYSSSSSYFSYLGSLHSRSLVFSQLVKRDRERRNKSRLLGLRQSILKPSSSTAEARAYSTHHVDRCTIYIYIYIYRKSCMVLGSLYTTTVCSLYAQLIAWCGKRCRVLPLNCLNIDSGLYSPPFLYLTALDVHSWP